MLAFFSGLELDPCFEIQEYQSRVAMMARIDPDGLIGIQERKLCFFHPDDSTTLLNSPTVVLHFHLRWLFSESIEEEKQIYLSAKEICTMMMM